MKTSRSKRGKLRRPKEGR